MQTVPCQVGHLELCTKWKAQVYAENGGRKAEMDEEIVHVKNKRVRNLGQWFARAKVLLNEQNKKWGNSCPGNEKSKTKQNITEPDMKRKKTKTQRIDDK